MSSIKITIPAELATAIDNYLATDWKDGRDPSKLGALNAVAYIGEHIAGLYEVAKAAEEETCTVCRHTRAWHREHQPRHRFAGATSTRMT